MIDDVSNDGPTEQELEALWRVLMRAALRTGEGDVCSTVRALGLVSHVTTAADVSLRVCGAPLLRRTVAHFLRLGAGCVYGVFRCDRCRGRLGVFSEMR